MLKLIFDHLHLSVAEKRNSKTVDRVSGRVAYNMEMVKMISHEFPL